MYIHIFLLRNINIIPIGAFKVCMGKNVVSFCLN
jgi:hypothetical protein